MGRTDAAGSGGARTRIQAENRARLISAALAVFSRAGYEGATVDALAEAAGMSKPNLLYYFSSKEALYRAALDSLLEHWLEPLEAIDPDGEPLDEIGRYVTRKLAMSAEDPAASRLFANEIMRGAPVLGEVLAGPLRALVDEKAAVIAVWAADGRIACEEPRHLIFAIWATTQHYADFDAQVRAVLGDGDGQARFEAAGRMLSGLFLRGLTPGADTSS
ncbi:MAG: TetR family transcriptional regulator C-terminal domain-containing protein [Pseudomonadota bacterium]